MAYLRLSFNIYSLISNSIFLPQYGHPSAITLPHDVRIRSPGMSYTHPQLICGIGFAMLSVRTASQKVIAIIIVPVITIAISFRFILYSPFQYVVLGSLAPSQVAKMCVIISVGIAVP